jgi:drug/metabolite transporter, DME family
VLAVFVGADVGIRRERSAEHALGARLGRLSASRKRALLIGGICGALLNIAMFAAFQRMSIAVALVCFYTFPALVTLAAVPLYGERLEPRRLAALGLSITGLLLVLLAPLLQSGSGLAIDGLGVTLALFAAICQTAWFLIAGRGFRPLTAIDVSLWLLGSALLIAVALGLAIGSGAGLLLPGTQPRLWPWIIAGGVTGAAIPTTAFMAGIARIGPSRTAILMTFEPVVGVSLATLLLGERPLAIQLVGGICVVAAAALLQTMPLRLVSTVEPPVV